MGSVELLLCGWAVAARKEPAPRPPRWGQALRRALAVAFGLVGRTLFKVRVRGIEHFRNRPATLVVANHKTDFDIVLLAPTLYWAHRGKGPVAHLAFVAADRMFQPGYFSTYLVPRPRWLSRLLFPVNLSEVLKALYAYPVPHAHRRKLGAYLGELLAREGDLPLEAIFRAPASVVIAGLPEDATIRDALRWRHREALDEERDFSIFTPALGKSLRERHLETIFASLARFAAILERGDPVYLAPEGGLSPDGTFGRVRAGLPRLIQMVERELTLLPVNLTYDFLTTGRPTVFLSIGQELRGVQSWSKEELEAEVERAITGLGTVTLTQLAAHAVGEREGGSARGVSEGALKAAVREHARQLAAQEYTVDERLLDNGAFERRWRRFVRYGRRKGLLIRSGELLFPASESATELPGGLELACSPWRYGENELDAILGAGAQRR